MKSIIGFFITLIFLSFNCKKEKFINGSWCFNIDSTYYELYINDSLITECNDNIMGLSITYKYILIQDTICVYSEDQIKNKIPIIKTNFNSIEIFYQEQWAHCKRVDNIKDVYEIENNDQEGFDEFLFNFKLRAQKAKITASLGSPEAVKNK